MTGHDLAVSHSLQTRLTSCVQTDHSGGCLRPNVVVCTRVFEFYRSTRHARRRFVFPPSTSPPPPPPSPPPRLNRQHPQISFHQRYSKPARHAHSAIACCWGHFCVHSALRDSLVEKTKHANSVLLLLFHHRSVCVRLCCLLYTSPSPRDRQKPRMPSSA